MMAAVCLPGLYFSLEDSSKSSAVPRPSSPLAVPGASWDASAMLRQQLGFPKPWALEEQHLACVCLLLLHGAGLHAEQRLLVEGACDKLAVQQVPSY